MQVGRTDPNVLDARVADARGGAGFATGQHLAGRVVEQTGDGQFVLAFGDRRVAAHSVLPLAVGQPIQVEVTKTGASIELRLLSAPEPPSPRLVDQQVALAVVLGAMRAAAPPDGADGPALSEASAVLLRQAAASLPPDEAQALARQLTPLPVGADPKAVADALRAVLETGGLLFEARVRQLLAARPDLTDAQILALLRHDLRALLGRLGRQAEGGSDAADADAAPGDPAANAAAGSLVGSRVLARQLASAAHWLADGTLAFHVTAQLWGGPASVRVRMRRDGSDADAGERGGSRPCSVVVRIDGEATGAIEAQARWSAGSVRTVFTVEREATRDRLAADLEWYAASLRDGFSRVTADVCVDAGYLRRTAADPLPVLPDGAIVNRRV